MKTQVDSSSSAASGRIETKRSVVSLAFSVLAAGAALFGAGAAMASPSSMVPGDALLAFHVK
ncbi:hypothetical protein [Mycobacterium sp.]|uniref:hypothetical protein n=1 Tax=Mycobacterium sp. TaxID=1785 RepID=UPI0025DCDCDE|nr:hypothetical protein [Mycobacterium sp.]